VPQKVNKTTKRAGEVKKHEAADRGFNRRWRFTEQIKRFWRKSMEKNAGNSPPIQEKQGPPPVTQ